MTTNESAEITDKINAIKQIAGECDGSDLKQLTSALEDKFHWGVRACSFYYDEEADMYSIWLQYREWDDDGWYYEDIFHIFPRHDVDLKKMSLRGLERRCQYTSPWTAPEFGEVIRRADLSAAGKTGDAYMHVLWLSAKKLGVWLC